MSTDLRSIGLGFERWQDAVEAAIATTNLTITGEVRGGQHIQFADPSGAQINILAVEPYATYAGFESETRTFGNVTMINDVVAYLEVMDSFGKSRIAVTANLAQGPLLVDELTQEWAELGVTALVLSHSIYPSTENYEEATGEPAGKIISPGAEIVASGSGASVPDAGAQFSARVLEAEHRLNQLTGQKFIYAQVDGAFPFDVCLPYSEQLPEKNSVIVGHAVLVASIMNPVGGGGCCGGACGCG